jgi:hypothetical protein
MKTLKVGVIGGGLMGREVASAIGRWCALLDFPVKLELTAVCDLVEKTREWFRQIPTVSLLTADHRELLASDLDFVYVAVPHHLHLDLYLDVLRAGKDLLAEKPFGIDLAAAQEDPRYRSGTWPVRPLLERVPIPSRRPEGVEDHQGSVAGASHRDSQRLLALQRSRSDEGDQLEAAVEILRRDRCHG